MPTNVTIAAEPRPPRRPMQVALAADPSGEGFRIVALCNDGTIWSMSARDEWRRLPRIPEE